MNRHGVLARGAALLAAAALVAACDLSPQVVRTGGTGSPTKAAVASGPITGLGGIVVGGVRFDESGAEVTINGAANRPVSELALGMIVEVRGEIDAIARTGKASTVVATALIAGPVAAVDPVAGEIVVLGQRVEVFPDTALQGSSSLAGIRAGDAVVVYGFWDYFAGHVDATRLEIAPSAAAAATIIGKVGEVTGTRLRLGALVVESAGAAVTGLDGGIASGRYVEIRGTLDAAGILRAASVASRIEFDPVEGAQTEIEGYVTDFAGLGSFRVLGLPVNGAGARLEGAVASFANGALVEVEGRVEGGVLVATVVDVKAGALQPSAPVPVTLQGAISDFVSVSSFRVNDQAVDAGAASFAGGAAADLANGRTVQVTGIVAGDVLRASGVVFPPPAVVEGARFAVDGAIEAFASPMNFRVNGLPVSASAGTGYSGGSVADLANGRRVHVDGLLASGVLAAWTITFQPIEVVTTVTLSGVVSDFVSPASFRVNNQAIAADSLTAYQGGTAASLANGRMVEVQGRLAAGVVTATLVRFPEPPESGGSAEVEGRITDFVSVASFKVQGQLIDATAATYSHGGPADLVNGLKVHVKGPVSQGVLKAKTVEIDR